MTPPKRYVMTTIDEKEIKGLNMRTLVTLAIGMLTIEATILGVYYGMKESITQVNYTNQMQDKRMDLLEGRTQKLEDRVERTEINYNYQHRVEKP